MEQSKGFAEEFEVLRLQARDLESMVNPKSFEQWLLPVNLRKHPPGIGDGLPDPFVIPRLERFNREAIALIEEIRDFKETALQLKPVRF